MPACSSSPIPTGLGRLADARPPAPDEHSDLLACLAAVPDPRRAKGRRHPLAFVLALAACAVLAGAKSLRAIAEWAAEAPPAVLTALGGPSLEPAGPTAPADATTREVRGALDHWRAGGRAAVGAAGRPCLHPCADVSGSASPAFPGPSRGDRHLRGSGLQVFGSVTPGRADLDDLPQAEGM